jgi:hypothetical protein
MMPMQGRIFRALHEKLVFVRSDTSVAIFVNLVYVGFYGLGNECLCDLFGTATSQTFASPETIS